MKIFAILLVVLFVKYSEGHSYNLGECPNVQPMTDFDMYKFLGSWYVIRKTSTSSSCVIYNFTRADEPDTYSIEQISHTIIPGKHAYHYTGELTVPDSAIPARMKVKFPLNEVTYNYPAVDFNLADVKIKDISFHLFSPIYKNGIYLDFGNLNNIVRIDTTLPTTFLIHGWYENETTYWYDIMKTEYFKKGDYNVIYVDWRIPASRRYSTSAANTKSVGFVIADLILSLEFDLKNVHLIGHSLGSHVAGFAGKSIYKRRGLRIRRITATDPAREEFEHESVHMDSRLSRFDADIVDVLHTDMGHYGFIAPIGTVDFYFNGGKEQPGCPPLLLRIDDNCHHQRSNMYYAESINSEDFIACKCPFEAKDRYEVLHSFNEAIFGENMSLGAYGVYCLATNDRSPLAKG